jgi:imidazolonepropionase-like amidohydrolase
MIKLYTTLICFLFTVSAFGQMVGKGEYGTFILENAEIHTVTNGIIKGSVLIVDGKIKQVGEIAYEPTAVKIDCSGKRIYPGFIDSGTTLGLNEIGAVSLTRDANEIGEFTPQMKALTAVNPNSVLIPVTRVNGVTTVLSTPQGGIFPGTAVVIDLWGYTPKQMSTGTQVLMVNYPNTGKRGWWDRRSAEDIKKDAEKAVKKLNDYWEKAVSYSKIYEAVGNDVEYNPELESMRSAVNKNMKVVVNCNSKDDILNAIKWIKKNDVDGILSGVREGYMVADSIAKAGIPVITGPILGMPSRASESYDSAYKNAGVMQKAGVLVSIQTSENENVRNLLYNAGFAATYGMGTEEAVKAITINAAKIFGLEESHGSIEVGKSANLFICDGDPFETKTTIDQVFIDGWKIPMESRHTLLYDEFLSRNPGLNEK